MRSPTRAIIDSSGDAIRRARASRRGTLGPDGVGHLTRQGQWSATAAELKRVRPWMPVLVLSMHAEEQYARRAFRAGASGSTSARRRPKPRQSRPGADARGIAVTHRRVAAQQRAGPGGEPGNGGGAACDQDRGAAAADPCQRDHLGAILRCTDGPVGERRRDAGCRLPAGRHAVGGLDGSRTARHRIADPRRPHGTCLSARAARIWPASRPSSTTRRRTCGHR
jgi:hypothetical protein